MIGWEPQPEGQERWRLFVAIEVPLTVRDAVSMALADLRQERAQHLRWTDPNSWHITLAFLGAIHPSWSDAIEQALIRGVADERAFAVSLRKAGRFGRSVLFLGFDDTSYGRIVDLGTAVRQSLALEGVPFDDKPLHPHLTLARPRERRGIGVSRSRLGEVDQALTSLVAGLSWPVTHVELVRSHAGEGVPRYDTLVRVPLLQA